VEILTEELPPKVLRQSRKISVTLSPLDSLRLFPIRTRFRRVTLPLRDDSRAHSGSARPRARRTERDFGAPVGQSRRRYWIRKENLA